MKKPSNVYSRDVIRLIIKNQDRHNIPRSIIERLAKSKTRPIPMKNKGKA